MRVFSAPDLLFQQVSDWRLSKKSVGLVPTMGALHDGHLSLIAKAKEQNDVVIVSIFVNPLQFNNAEDLANYPRTEEDDKIILEKEGIDALFVPSVNEMYPSKPKVSINFGGMENLLEGKFRKNHFEGVGVIVGKLLHASMPDRAYFGLKDLQQFLLVKKMCIDLGFPVEIIGVDTIRQTNGLALSSRNRRLSGSGLETAAHIYKALKMAEAAVSDRKSIEEIKEEVQLYFESLSGLDIEYFEVVDVDNLEPITSYDELNELAICIAGYVDGVRLIDNLYLRLK